MKKYFAIFALTALATTGMQAQTVAEPVAQQAEVNTQFDNNDDGISKKFELRLDAAYATNLKGLGFSKGSGGGIFKGEECGLITLGVGYNFTSNWYAGLASGYAPNMAGTENKNIPLLADVAYRYNFPGARWSVFGEVRAGYMFSVTAKELINNTGEMASYPNAFMGEIEAGAYWRILRNLDLKLALGYLHYNPSEKGGHFNASNGNYLMLKVGFNFRLPNFPKVSHD